MQKNIEAVLSIQQDFHTFYGRLYRDAKGQPYDPFPYQVQFAEQLISDRPPNSLTVPTGCGKESAVIAAFLWQIDQKTTWKRLAYCLPTRALVAQVAVNTEKAIATAQLDISVHILQGGAIDRHGLQRPEQPCIFIGTQDQLLSRALNRGYAMSPYQWPIDFGLLSQDTLWVFDETQLMGAGFNTSIQLQGLRDRFLSWRPTHSIWLSATLDESRLAQFPDYQTPLLKVALSATDRCHPLLQKRLSAKKQLLPRSVDKGEVWQQLAQDAIAASDQGNVLIVVNQVKRAQAIAQVLAKQEIPYQLVHSRFREGDRPNIENLKAFQGIIIATQAIEAGKATGLYKMVRDITDIQNLTLIA